MERKLLAGLAALAVAATSWIAVPTASAAAANDLIISEYVEGSSFNKAIELYNGTDAAIDLSGYRLELYSNGSSAVNTGLELQPSPREPPGSSPIPRPCSVGTPPISSTWSPTGTVMTPSS